jgi:hypothetical protein
MAEGSAEKEPQKAPDAAAPPRALLVFQNPDKLGARASGPDDAMPGWPFRILFSGPPGCGKRNLLLNVVFRLRPLPSSIHVVHYDADTREYEELETLGRPIYYYTPADFPTIDNITNPDPPPIGDTADSPEEDPLQVPEDNLGSDPLVIIDEVTDDVLPNAEMKQRFERLMNYGSSHRNCSVMCSIQSLVNIPAKCRRGFNHFCLWKQPDETASALAANRAGVPVAMLRELFEGLCTDPHDSIWVDTTKHPDSPWRLRLNFLWPIRATSTVKTSEYA